MIFHYHKLFKKNYWIWYRILHIFMVANFTTFVYYSSHLIPFNNYFGNFRNSVIKGEFISSPALVRNGSYIRTFITILITWTTETLMRCQATTQATASRNITLPDRRTHIYLALGRPTPDLACSGRELRGYHYTSGKVHSRSSAARMASSL